MIQPLIKYSMLVIIVIFLFFLFTSFLGFYTTIRPKKIISHSTPQDFNLPFEEVSFKADKMELKGWFIPAEKDKAKTIILLHGYPADKSDILPRTLFLHNDYNLLLFDFRYLGQSQGKYTTLGIKEVDDLLAAIDYLKSRDISEVGVWGFSMGAAVALMASPDAPEVKAVVSESSYASLELLSHQLYIYPVLKYPLGFFTTLWGKILLGIDFKKQSPVKAAEKINIPVLLIHSENDQVFDIIHAQMLKEALKDNPEAEVIFTEDAVHGELGPVQQKAIEDFFKNNL